MLIFVKKQSGSVFFLGLFCCVTEVEKDTCSVDGVAGQGAAAADICIETTAPKQGQNLWWGSVFCCSVY